MRRRLLATTALATLLLLAPAARAAPAFEAATARSDARGTTIAFAWDGLVDVTLRQDGRALRLRFSEPVSKRIGHLMREADGAIAGLAVSPDRLTVTIALRKPVRASIERDGTAVLLVLGEPATAAQPAPAAQPAQVPPAQAAPAPAVPVEAAAVAATEPAAGPAPDRTDRNARRTTGLVPVEARRDGNGVVIRFLWRRETAAAVFRREDDLWIVFDGPARLDTDTIRRVGRETVGEVVQPAHAEAAVVRIPAGPHMHASVRREDTIWIVELQPGPPPTPASPVTPVVEEEPGRPARVLLPIKGLGHPIVLDHPEIGDRVHVYPATAPGQGLTYARNLVDAELLQSAQGAAIVPQAERLRIAARPQGVLLEADRGLQVSRGKDIAGRNPVPATVTRALDLAGLTEGHYQDLPAVRDDLLQRLARMEPAHRNDLRLELARVFLAHGQAPEALGAAEVVDGSDPRPRHEAPMRAVRGAARVVLGQFAEAAEDLDHPVLRPYRETAIWRAMLAAARGDWKEAHALARDDQAKEGLPPWIAVRARLVALEAALAVGETDDADRELAALDRLAPAPAQSEAAELLRGHLKRKKGDDAGAEATWTALAETASTAIQVRARFALVDLRRAKGTIDAAEAIAELERLSFAWRGDVFEFDVLRKLAQLQAETGAYREALTRLRTAASNFDNVEGAQTVAQEMGALFRRLYMDGAADRLPPVTALALFEEFRELTPSGEDGDAMIRRLADRLVEADLLAEAGEILENQVKNRLSGRLKAEVGTRLAMIRLLDRRYDDVLAAIGDSNVPDIAPALAAERRVIEARALVALGRIDDARRRLGDDDGLEADDTRLEIAWNKKDWPGVARFARRMLEGRADATLDARAGMTVLRWAVAATLADDRAGIADLRRRFSPAMASHPMGDLFRGIVGADGLDPAAFRAFALKAAELDTFQAFLAQYRERIKASAVGG